MAFKEDFHEEVKEILSSVDMSKHRNIILNSKPDFQGYKETSDNAEQVVLKEALIEAMDKGVKAQREALDNAEQVELKHYHYNVKDDGREM